MGGVGAGSLGDEGDDQGEDSVEVGDALIWLACDPRDVISAGDHVIVTGEVRALEAREGDPLVFHADEYRTLD